jgi:cobalt-zinc-cadmium efflux system outer membrane protein
LKRGYLATRLALLAGLLAGCVSENAGYQDVRKVVASRTGHEVRWQHLEGDATTRKRTRELLSRPLTSEAAVRLALLNNADLQAAFEDLGVARAELMRAWALPNPVAEGSVRFRGEGTPTIDLSVSEDISELILLPLRSGAARADLDAAKLEVAGRAMDLVLEARSAFYAYLADEQLLELRSTVLQALEAAATVAKSLHEAGNITDLDLSNEQVLYDEARVNLASAQAALASSRQRLTSLLGLWGREGEWRVEARLADPPEMAVGDVETKAIANSVDLAAIRHRFTAAARRTNLAQAEGLLPELKLGATLEREEGEWSYGPLAEVELPLFYQGQGEVARAEAEMRRQRQLLAARAVQIRATAREAALRVAAARDRASYVKNVLMPARARIVEQTQLQFNAMNVSVFQLLLAKRDQVETARAYVETLREYWVARAELEQLRSGRLTARVASIAAAAESPSSRSRAGGH